MTQTLNGTIRNGRVEVTGLPSDAEGARVVVTVLDDASGPTARPTEAERERAIDELIEQMKTTQVTGGRGYLFREELYDRRANG